MVSHNEQKGDSVEDWSQVDGYISSKCTLDCVRDSAIEMINYNFSLIQSINLWWWEVGNPVSQNRSVAPLQQNCQTTPEVVDSLALLLSHVSEPSFLTSLSPTRCHQPKVSAATGKKAIPCLRHNSSAPLNFSSYLTDRA